MAFKLGSISDAFPYSVLIPQIDANGRRQTPPVEFRFKRLTQEDYQDVVKRAEQVREESGSLDAQTDQIMDLVDGWKERDVIGADGEPIPFSRDVIRQMLNECPGAFPAIITAFIEAWQGGAKRKNS